MSEAPVLAGSARTSKLALARAFAALLLLAASAAFAFFWAFGSFSEYDDEGYLMLTVRHLLEGRRLYDDVRVPYGPAYYAWRWLIHGVAGAPLDNATVRFGAICAWLASALAAAWLVHRLVRGRQVAFGLVAMAFAVSVVHLRTLAAEPGAPQEIATLVLALALAASAQAGVERGRTLAFVLGAAASALLLVKVNIGALFVIALVPAFALAVPARGALRVLALTVALAVLAVPALLMRSHLDADWAQRFCAVVTASLIGAFAAAREPLALRWSARHLLAFAAGAALAGGAAVAFALLHGSSPEALLQRLFVDPARFPAAFALPREFPLSTLLAAAASATVALLRAFGGGGLRAKIETSLVPWMRLALFTIAVFGLADPPFFLKYGTPLVWVVVIDPAGSTASGGSRFLRQMLACVAILQSLQAYPVAGSQVATGTATALTLAIVCLSDLWLALPIPLSAHRRAGSLATEVLGCVLASAAIALVASWVWIARSSYAEGEPLERSGRPPVRVSERQAATYRWLADNVRASADTFVSAIGSNSLYFWTDRRPPTELVVSHTWQLVTREQQERLVAALRAEERSLVIDHPGLLASGERAGMPFFGYVARECRPIGRFDAYTLLVRANRAAVPLESCAWREAGIRAELAAPGEQVLRIALPRERALEGIVQVRVFDLAGKRLWAFTGARKPSLQARLCDGDGEELLPARASVRLDGRAERELFLVLPEHPGPRPPRLPLLRFLGPKGERLLSLPLVTDVEAD